LSPTSAAVGDYELAFSRARRLKAAEFWLKLGEVDEALRELAALPLKPPPPSSRSNVVARRALRLSKSIGSFSPSAALSNAR